MVSNVELFDYTGDFYKLACVARTSYGKDPIVGLDERRELYKKIEQNKGEDAVNAYQDWLKRAKKTVQTCFDCGHLTVFEFVDVTFWVHCPIYVARQLMRYRNASYIERSLRRCDPLPADEGQESVANRYYNESIEHYNHMLECYKKEFSRSALTLAAPTEFLMKVDFRELFHIFDERLTKETQDDTRECVAQMYKRVEETPDLSPFVELYRVKRELIGTPLDEIL